MFIPMLPSDGIIDIPDCLAGCPPSQLEIRLEMTRGTNAVLPPRLPASPPPRHVGCQRPLAHRVSVAEFRPRPCWLNLPPLCSCVIMHDRLPLFCELQRDWVSFVIDYRHGSQSRLEEVFREKKKKTAQFFKKKASSRVVITGNSTSSTTSRMGT